ncbi:MAG: type II toxin-antitoxin system mRNA interferase toxin, RelE/StbE family [Candidatus Zambryskibacteria bacterium]|nr:type II toxin-antitoxin system mRNA interferase toxin, RelE/StbE family [Candidatus Zambryskibacteria bacterium]
MIVVNYAPKFLRRLKKLEPTLIKEVKRKIYLFQTGARHAPLKVHKLHGELSECFAFSINYEYRIVFEYVSGSEVNLLAIDDHDVYKKK